MQRHRILGWLTALFADTGHGARQAGVAQVDKVPPRIRPLTPHGKIRHQTIASRSEHTSLASAHTRDHVILTPQICVRPVRLRACEFIRGRGVTLVWPRSPRPTAAITAGVLLQTRHIGLTQIRHESGVQRVRSQQLARNTKAGAV